MTFIFHGLEKWNVPIVKIKQGQAILMLWWGDFSFSTWVLIHLVYGCQVYQRTPKEKRIYENNHLRELFKVLQDMLQCIQLHMMNYLFTVFSFVLIRTEHWPQLLLYGQWNKKTALHMKCTGCFLIFFSPWCSVHFSQAHLWKIHFLWLS